MIYNCDFIINASPEMTPAEMQIEILEHLLVRTIESNMPCVVVVTAKSGRGKSWSTLDMIDDLFKKRNVDLKEYLEKVVIMNPMQYAEKVKAVLLGKKYKKVFAIQIDEARTVVGSKNWNSFVNQAINDINATARAVKPIITFVVTQDLKDVDLATRKTIDYYFKYRRTKGKPPEMVPYYLWVDDNDVEKPKLRKRRIYGVIKQNGKKYHVKPVFKFNEKPREEIRLPYEKMMIDGKAKFLNRKINDLIDRIEKEVKVDDYAQVAALFKHFIENPVQLKAWAEYKRKKWRIKRDMVDKLGLKPRELAELELRLTEHKPQEGGLGIGQVQTKEQSVEA